MWKCQCYHPCLFSSLFQPSSLASAKVLFVDWICQLGWRIRSIYFEWFFSLSLSPRHDLNCLNNPPKKNWICFITFSTSFSPIYSRFWRVGELECLGERETMSYWRLCWSWHPDRGPLLNTTATTTATTRATTKASTRATTRATKPATTNTTATTTGLLLRL